MNKTTQKDTPEHQWERNSLEGAEALLRKRAAFARDRRYSSKRMAEAGKRVADAYDRAADALIAEAPSG